MDYQTFFLLLSFILTCIYLLVNHLGSRMSDRNIRLPPGPYPFSIIGNIFEFGDKPHKSLASLAKKYGPLMSLKLGTITTIVISSPEIAKQFFHKHDQSFTGRPDLHLAHAFDHFKYSITFMPVSDRWRRLRRISKELLFSVQNLDATTLIRRKKVQEFLDHVDKCCANGKPVDIGAAMFTTMVNVLSNFIFSIDLAQIDSFSSQEFVDSLWGLIKVGGASNIADLFPILRPFDLQGLRREGDAYMKKLVVIIDGLITQRVRERSLLSSNSLKYSDVLDSLLDMSEKSDSNFGRIDILHFILALFLAGTDTTSATVEWAMAELINNPEKMSKARHELNETLGNDKKIAEESDIMKLPYLQAVLKETLRLHPPVPFLVPHVAINDVEIQNFVIPKDSQILCNVWAISLDPKYWPTPESFIPERFLATELDFRGRDFELIPFGSGRRSCPGMNLGDRILRHVLGCLICKFEWKLEGGMRGQDLDMSEKFGMTMPKALSLKAIPIKV